MGRRNLEAVGIRAAVEDSRGDRAGGAGRHEEGEAQIRPPCAGQMQDGKREPHQSGGCPGQSRREPRACTALVIKTQAQQSHRLRPARGLGQGGWWRPPRSENMFLESQSRELGASASGATLGSQLQCQALRLVHGSLDSEGLGSNPSSTSHKSYNLLQALTPLQASASSSAIRVMVSTFRSGGSDVLSRTHGTQHASWELLPQRCADRAGG